MFLEESETYKIIIEKGAKQEKIAIAKEMLKEGIISIDKISKITKLSIEEIKKLI